MQVKEILMYPNPVRDELNIVGEYNSLNIYDISGKLVLSTDRTRTIDVSRLENGIYLVNVISKNQNITNKITITR